MTKRIRTLIGLILLILGFAGCSDRSLAVAPSGPPLTPAGPSEPKLITFTEQGTGFSTADLYDARQLVVTPTGTYPPGSPTLSGVIYEQAAGGQVAVEDATVAVSVSSGWRYTVTDTKSYYEVHGLFDGAKSLHVAQEGYGTAVGSAAIKGDTSFDVELVRR